MSKANHQFVSTPNTCGTRGKDFIAWKEHTLCGEILDVLGDVDDGFENGDVLECLRNVDVEDILYEWRHQPRQALAVVSMWTQANDDGTNE